MMWTEFAARHDWNWEAVEWMGILVLRCSCCRWVTYRDQLDAVVNPGPCVGPPRRVTDGAQQEVR